MNAWPLLFVLLAHRSGDDLAVGRGSAGTGMRASSTCCGPAAWRPARSITPWYCRVHPCPACWSALMGGLWGARLCWHLARRVFNEEEDGRYRNLRKRWNGNQRNFLLFFLAQAGFVVLFSFPFWIAAHNPVAAMDAMEGDRDRGLAGCGGRRRHRRPPTRRAPRGSGEQGQDLPQRSVALFAPPQLFLRIRALVRLRVPGHRAGPRLGGRQPGRPRSDAGIPLPRHRHSLHRSAGPAHPRRGLRRVPAHHQFLSYRFPRSLDVHPLEPACPYRPLPWPPNPKKRVLPLAGRNPAAFPTISCAWAYAASARSD